MCSLNVACVMAVVYFEAPFCDYLLTHPPPPQPSHHTQINAGNFPFHALQYNYYDLNQEKHTVVLDLQ
jgi:hypothetical protein